MMLLGESSGARILAVGDTITQVGTEYQLDVTTWDLIPAGEVGDVLFRTIDVTLHTNSTYLIGITPIVDGVSLTEQTFSGTPDSGGEVQCQAYLAERGTRIAARVRTLSRTGAIALHNIASSFVVIRATP